MADSLDAIIAIVTPDAALRRQIEIYRSLTAEQRLAIGLELHSLSVDVAREGIRQQFPSAGAEELERRLRQRLALTRR